MAIVQNGLLAYWNSKAGVTSGNLTNIAPGGITLPAALELGAYYDTNTQAIYLDGVDDRISIANDTMFKDSAAFTFEYVYTTRGVQTSGYHLLYGGAAYMDTDYAVPGIYFQLMQNGSSRIPFEGVTAATDTPQQMHVVVQYDDAQNLVRLYVNGTQLLNITNETRTLRFALNTSTPLTFNYMSGGYTYLPINFHAVRFYDRVLTPQEVAQNYANGTEIGLTVAPVEVTGAASLSANASAVQSALKIQTAAAAVTGNGATTSQAVRQQSAMTTMTTSGSITGGGLATRLGTTALIATAQSSATGTTVSGVIAGATIGAVSTIGTTSVRMTDAGASMNGAALLTTTAVAIIDVRAEATLTGESSSTQSAIATREDTAQMSAESSAAVAGETVFSVAVEMAVAASTTATPEVGFEAASTLVAATEIESQPIAHREDGATMAGASTLDVNAISGTEVSAVLAAESTGSASAIRILTDAGTAASSAILATDSVITREDTAELTAATEMLATPERTQTFEATLAGAGGSLQDGIRIVNVSSQIGTSGTIETDPAILHTAAIALDVAADISAASETVAVTEMTAVLTGSVNLFAASQKATSGSALLDIHSLTSTAGVRITPTESDLTATSGTDAAEPVRLAIASADMDAAAQAEAIASVIVAFTVTAGGSAELVAGSESATSAAAALLASANLDVDYAPGYVTTVQLSGTATARESTTATVDRLRVNGTLTKSVRAYGVYTRKEGV